MFKGDYDIRAKGEKVQMTHEQQQEWFKCAQDVNYFAENYFNIITLDNGLQLFKPYEYQRKTIHAMMNPKEGIPHTICMWPRQMGKCVFPDTKIKIRNKKTREIEEIEIVDFYKRVKNNG